MQISRLERPTEGQIDFGEYGTIPFGLIGSSPSVGVFELAHRNVLPEKSRPKANRLRRVIAGGRAFKRDRILAFVGGDSATVRERNSHLASTGTLGHSVANDLNLGNESKQKVRI